MKKGDIISVCPQCRRVVNFSNTGYKHKPIEDDIIERGVECPYCQYWQHSCYLTTDLLQEGQQVVKAARPIRREFQKKFKKFQKRMRAKYGISGQSHQSQEDESRPDTPTVA